MLSYVNTSPLPFSFYQDVDVVTLSQLLLGKILITKKNGIIRSGIITETEAYRGPEDKASHAYAYRKSNRTKIMYSAGGHSYVYLCYGIHRLFNVVTGPEDIPHAVLIRAIQPLQGIEYMLKSRKMTILEPRLCAGPGALSAAMGIELQDNGSQLLDPESSITIHDNFNSSEIIKIACGPRIGVEYAGEWALRPWRFLIHGNIWVSRRDKAKLYE